MRIDASGNLYSQTTTLNVGTSSTETGMTHQAGQLQVSANGYQAAIFNRLQAGTIADFRVDGTPVGSIGTYSSRLFIGSGDTGIFFDPTTDDAIKPWNTSTNAGRDAAIDLGDSGTRFKDLYLSNEVIFGSSTGSIGVSGSYLAIGNASGLRFDDSLNRILPFNTETPTATNGTLDIGSSGGRFKDLYLAGGAYLGGTGSANKLDDYEEGTWTPTINSGTISATEATYTKIGNVVTLRANIGDISDNTSATDINISGIPFTSNSSNRAVGSCMFRYFSKTNLAQVTPYIGQSRTLIEFYVSFNANATWTPLQFDDGAQANMDIIFTLTYMAT